MTETRKQELEQWLNQTYSDFDLKPLNNDASFRKYYRFQNNQDNLIAVDSPPDKEKNAEFVGVQSILASGDVNVPEIYDKDFKRGFFVIEDYGDKTLLPNLKNFAKPELGYENCISELIKIQSIEQNQMEYKLGLYDRCLLQTEMDLFRDWFLAKYLNVNLTVSENNLLNDVFANLIECAQNQPQVLVHRDYHSRNLMILNSGNIGVIDFQDAVIGPITYDLVSLYRDCYIAWPQDTVNTWVNDYLIRLKDNKLVDSKISNSVFWHWFLTMTMQRHFKTIGIFSRLYLRDNKSGYLNDIPRTLNYLLDASHYLSDDILYKNIYDFLNTKIVDSLRNKQQ